MPERREDFYIGYQPQASATVRGWIRAVVGGVLALAVVVPIVLISAQRGFSDATFEYGKERSFEGRLAGGPYPALHTDTGTGVAPHLLVELGKMGARASASDDFSDHQVRARGTLIYSGTDRMIELAGTSLEGIGQSQGTAPPGSGPTRATLTGEILDSKCYLGVMKPGRGKTHRSCAARCISGGIPPVFSVTDREGEQRLYLISGERGEAIGTELLPLVGEPVRVTGEVWSADGLWRLRAAPRAFASLVREGARTD